MAQLGIFPSIFLHVLAALASCCLAQPDAYTTLVFPADRYSLPSLPYQYDELEPFLGANTLRVHHLGHHKAYTDKMNLALSQWREEEPDDAFAQSSILNILQHISQVPEKWRTALRNNGGGYINHIFYWCTMCVKSSGDAAISTALSSQFGNLEQFKKEFSQAAAGLFGSGYVWLVEDDAGTLSITTTANQDSPLSQGLVPLLVLDVWEHAYYLQYQNKRVDYIDEWWGLVCWERVAAIRKFWGQQNAEKTHSEL